MYPRLWIAALLMRAVLETTVNHRYLYLVVSDELKGRGS